MGIKEILASKASEAKALAAQGANAVSHTPIVGNIAIGMQGSTEGVQSPAPVAPDNRHEFDAEKAEKALAVYEDNTFRPLRSLVRASGNRIFVSKGFFYAETEEDVAALEHYRKNNFVTKYEPQSSLELNKTAK